MAEPSLRIEWSPDGRRVLTAGLSPEVKVWDAATGELALPPLLMKTKPVEGARFSADGRFIVAHSDDDLVRVWDAATGEAVTPLLPHQDTRHGGICHRRPAARHRQQLSAWCESGT